MTCVVEWASAAGKAPTAQSKQTAATQSGAPSTRTSSRESKGVSSQAWVGRAVSDRVGGACSVLIVGLSRVESSKVRPSFVQPRSTSSAHRREQVTPAQARAKGNVEEPVDKCWGESQERWWCRRPVELTERRDSAISCRSPSRLRAGPGARLEPRAMRSPSSPHGKPQYTRGTRAPPRSSARVHDYTTTPHAAAIFTSRKDWAIAR